MATVQANCRACRSDVDEFKAHTAWIASPGRFRISFKDEQKTYHWIACHQREILVPVLLKSSKAFKSYDSFCSQILTLFSNVPPYQNIRASRHLLLGGFAPQ